MAANPFIGEAFAAGAEGAYKPDHLTAGPLLGGLLICPDLGVGFDTKRQGAMALAVNALGRGDIQVVIKPLGIDAYRRLRLTWPVGRAVVTLDHVAATYLGENERRAAKVGPLAWTSVQAVPGGGHVTSAGTAAEVTFDLDDAPPWPHALELTLRFKYLKLDPVFGAR